MDKEKIEEAKKYLKTHIMPLQVNGEIKMLINDVLLQYIDELEKENYIQRKQLNDAFNNGFISKQKIKDITDNLIIIENRDYIAMEKYRPIKNTKKDDCYKALIEIKKLVN